jgi:hypothetical protein
MPVGRGRGGGKDDDRGGGGVDGGVICLEVEEGAAAVGCPSDGQRNSGGGKERNTRPFHRQPLLIMTALMCPFAPCRLLHSCTLF